MHRPIAETRPYAEQSLDNMRETPHHGFTPSGGLDPGEGTIAVDDVVERKASLQHLVKVEAIHSDDARVAASALAQPNNGVRSPMH